MGFFNGIEQLPPDPIFGLNEAFREDPREEKINLGIGLCYREEGGAALPSAVRKAERKLIEEALPKSYLPIDGDPGFIEATADLLGFAGLYGAQTVGGTGALRISGELLRTALGFKEIYLPDPTWANHVGIFSNAGLEVKRYSYLKGAGVDLEALEQIPQGAALLFHPCCHNPTGMDPTQEQWQEIATLIEKRHLLPLFDCAYLGLGRGFEEDAFVPKLMVERGLDFLFTFSYSKSMGLYNERVGALFVQGGEIGSHVRQLIRRNYSNPPAHGARIARTVLRDFQEEWREEVGAMRERLIRIRTEIGLEGGNGLFALLGLSKEQVERLRKEWAIYMPKSSRINVTGLNRANIGRFLEALEAAR